MDTEKNPFEAVQSMMLDNLEKVGNATKSYLDMVQKAMLGMPAANETQIGTLRAYLDRQVAANQTFVSKLLQAKSLQEAVQIQIEYFQSQMRAAVDDARQLGENIAQSSRRATG